MVNYNDFQALDLKIAEIIEAKEHPNADRLYVLKVNIGDEERQIVAGIRGSYGVDELIGRKITVITNLEPAVIRGEESNGMLLAASTEGGGPVLISPEKDLPAGAKVK